MPPPIHSEKVPRSVSIFTQAGPRADPPGYVNDRIGALAKNTDLSKFIL